MIVPCAPAGALQKQQQQQQQQRLLLAAAPSSAHQPLRALSKTQHQRCHYPAATRCCFPAIDTAKLAPTFLVRATLRADHQSKCPDRGGSTMAAAQVRKAVIGPWRQYSRPFIVVSLALLRFKDGGAVLESNIDSSSRRRRELEVVADMDSEREPPSAAEIFDDLIHASSSEGFTYPSIARCHRAGNVSECQGFRVGSCWSEQIFGSLDLSSNHEVISGGATKKWTQKAQRLKKGGQGFCEGRNQARSWQVLNSYRFDFLSRANPIQECWMQRRPFSSSGVDVRDFIGKGAAAIAEIDRLADHTDPDDHRLKPLLKAAKENFELALEVDKHNTYAMLTLARLHLYNEIPGACLLRYPLSAHQLDSLFCPGLFWGSSLDHVKAFRVVLEITP